MGNDIDIYSVKHCHIQQGTAGDLRPKYDPGSAFNWSRLRKAFLQESRKKRG